MGKRIEAESSVKNKTKKGTKMGVEYVCENMRTRLRFLFTKNKSHFCANGRKRFPTKIILAEMSKVPYTDAVS